MPCPEWEVFDVMTPRELLELSDRTPESADARSVSPAVCELAEQHGWDTPLFRADHLLGAGTLRPEPVTPMEAGLAAAAAPWRAVARLWQRRHRDGRRRSPGCALRCAPVAGARAGALREQLVAVEALADDN